MLELALRKLYMRLMIRSMSELKESKLSDSALVFTPHPDDETLGCGGTIARKVKAGAKIKIIALTDGRNSHRNYMLPEKLKVIRANELLAAAKVLGLDQNKVMFLDFEDGNLGREYNEATEKVLGIICREQPQQIFVPYRKEMSPDHSITNMIVRSALKECCIYPTIYEYPVWFWCHWPWVSRAEIIHRKTLLKNSLIAWMGVRLLIDFNCSVCIASVLEDKRAALNKYKSQMLRLDDNAEWPTLNDIGGGQFLNCFFQEWEIFKRYRYRVEKN